MRVLRVLTRGNVGGPMRQALALWPQDHAAGLQTLVAIGRCAPAESEMDLTPIPSVASAEVTPEAHGLVRLQRLGRATRPWREALAVGELRQLIRRFRPDVVHTHTSQAGFFGRRAATLEKVPVIAHTFHGHVLQDYFSRPVNALFRLLETRAARRTDLLFAVSGSCRGELHALGVGAGRIEVIPPALDLAPFQATDRRNARARLQLDESRHAVGFVGRLVAVKQPSMFVAAVHQVPDAIGLVFGDGPLRSEVEDQTRITVCGAVDDMEARMAGLDALVLTSVREGCPLVALEAFAAGVPVVGLDAPGVRDALVDWGSGILVPRGEGATGVAAALRKLRAEPARAARCVVAAREGLGRFAARAVAMRLAADYARVAGHKLGRGPGMNPDE